MILKNVLEIGNPSLRKIAKPVNNISDPKIQKLIDNLLNTLMNINGVGMAAPQVNKSLRIFIVASHPNKRYPHAPEVKPFAMINPEIISHNKKMEKDWEGCLSVPNIRALVPRYTEIAVNYTDRKGKKCHEKYRDFVARIIQHENDHLDGILFPDRLETNRDIVSEKEYYKIIEKITNNYD